MNFFIAYGGPKKRKERTANIILLKHFLSVHQTKPLSTFLLSRFPSEPFERPFYLLLSPTLGEKGSPTCSTGLSKLPFPGLENRVPAGTCLSLLPGLACNIPTTLEPQFSKALYRAQGGGGRGDHDSWRLFGGNDIWHPPTKMAVTEHSECPLPSRFLLIVFRTQDGDMYNLLEWLKLANLGVLYGNKQQVWKLKLVGVFSLEWMWM